MTEAAAREPAGPLAPDSVALAEAAAGWRGAYVHVPFCARVCPYCDFAVVAGRDDEAAGYVRAVVAETAMEPPWGPLDAVHVGGGTPSRLAPELLDRVRAALADRFGLAPGAEVALEANPEDWTAAHAAAVRAAGFTRVSLGVQSFDAQVLAALGRVHTPEEGAAAVASARAAGFASVGLDLIAGTPGESGASWRATVAQALELGPDHLSVYSLTVERGTPLGRSVAAGAAAPDPDDQAEKYEEAMAQATAAGMVRYEVGNLARPGHHSRYNLLTWAAGEYAAFGAGAHGHRGGLRRRNHRRLEAYLGAVERGERPEAGSESLDGWGRERERVYQGQRRAAGVTPGAAGARLLTTSSGRRLVEAGVIGLREARLVVLDPLRTDAAAREVLALSAGEC